MLSCDNEKKLRNNNVETTNAVVIDANSIFLVKLNGVHSLNNNKKPFNPVNATQSVDISISVSGIILDVAVTASIEITIVSAQGSALFTIFKNKFPSMRLLLGSSANTNDGMPIVNILMSVLWMGIKGYGV